MSAGFKVHEFLKKKRVAFESIDHPKRNTAAETALAEHIPPHAFAKVVMVKLKGRDAMFVISANRKIDLFKLSYEFGTRDVRIEEENEFSELFTDSEKGAMPPFGALYGVPVYMDAELEKENEIYFNAGSHRQTIRMSLKDYLCLAEAEIGEYSVPRHGSEEERGETNEVICD